jgi:hypothetical protein
MLRTKGRYRNQALELDGPLALPEGTEVEIHIRLPGDVENADRQGWADLGISRLEEEWDNPEDALYDDWRRLYGFVMGSSSWQAAGGAQWLS